MSRGGLPLVALPRPASGDAPSLEFKQLAELLTPRVEISISGEKWPLVFTYSVLLACREELGPDLLKPVQDSGFVVRSLIHAALKWAGASYSLEEVGRYIGVSRFAVIRQIFREAWRASMPEPDAKKEEPESEDPEERPKLSWMQLWASARIEVGLSAAEWLEMTPRQFETLRKLRFTQMQREEMLAGIIASTVANFSMGAPKKPLKAADFMIHPLAEEVKRRDRGMTGEEIMAVVRRWKNS